MDWTDGPALVGAVVAVLALIGSGIGFLRSRSAAKAAELSAIRSEAAERRANEARDRAADALERANQLAEGAVVREDEDWFVEWRPDWAVHASILSLTNWGKDAARDASAVVTAPDLHLIHTQDGDVDPRGLMLIHMPQIAERRHRDEQHGESEIRELAAAGIFYARNSYREDLKIVVRWRTGQGRIQEQVLEHKVT